MKLKSTDRTRYPKFAKYVKESMPKVADVESIVKAFQKFGQIDRTTLRRALKWEELPNINIAPDPDNYGSFNGEIDPDTINLDSETVQKFEDGHGITKTAFGKDIYLIGAKLLHELVHWADHRDGIDYTDDGGEEGALFEKAVYGKVLH